MQQAMYTECFPFARTDSQIDESVNQMRHFEGMVLQNLEKIIAPKIVIAILKKLERLA